MPSNNDTTLPVLKWHRPPTFHDNVDLTSSTSTLDDRPTTSNNGLVFVFPDATTNADAAVPENQRLGEKRKASDTSNQPPDHRVELEECDCEDSLAMSFKTWRKWMILSVVFLVQVSMNFNTSIYANVIGPLAVEFSISEQYARVGQMIFLVAYAFGSELWAPWSEELGRWPVMQLSLLLVNIWQIPCALAKNFPMIIIGRCLGGLSSAGGSVTLGMVADMWDVNDQQYAVAFIVLSSVAGSVVAPIVGGFMQVHLHWRWNFWIQLILGGTVQLMHMLIVPETRATLLLDREAKRRREAGDLSIHGPGELHGPITAKELGEIWARPFTMFFREPIVFCLSLLSGFSDALIFTFLESFKPVFKQWEFDVIKIGLAFIP